VACQTSTYCHNYHLGAKALPLTNIDRDVELDLTVVIFSGMAFGYGLLGCGDDDCVDDDRDGYGTPGSTDCSFPKAGCDDSDPHVNPGVAEGSFGHDTCSDGLDNDCDGLIDANDSDCDDFEVIFPDPSLETAVREAISKPSGDILASDLQGLEHLYAWEMGIAEIVGLEHCLKPSLHFSTLIN